MMLKLVTFRSVLLALILTTLTSISASTPSHVATINAADSKTLTDNSTFFTIRPDMRRCASPMCGGYFVKQVNQLTTSCANGRNMAECYVADIEWNGAPEVDWKQALVRGSFLTRADRNGKYGILNVTETWEAFTSDKPLGDYYRVKDLGIRCIAAPCETHSEFKLNTALDAKIAGVGLASNDGNTDALTQALKAMTAPEGVIVVGTNAMVTGPAGRKQTLKATQFYRRKT
ncbi:MAG TPA: DUF6748 domain-containing protein [Pyrinomonadaceae bacterium]|jgi:hypothetical protein|nr:DUF6748 domain-containing protein [Pyrinomonadaceae bacterium]